MQFSHCFGHAQTHAIHVCMCACRWHNLFVYIEKMFSLLKILVTKFSASKCMEEERLIMDENKVAVYVLV